MRVKSLLLALLIPVIACSNSIAPWDRGDLREFIRAKQRWEARSFQDYSYEIRTFCFCPPELGLWTRVSVRDGVVVERVQVEPDPQFPITVDGWEPIDSLFSRLYRAMGESGWNSQYAKIEADYDPELGYPRSLSFVTKPNISDGGLAIEVRNVVPLN